MLDPEEVLRHAATFYQAGRLAEAEELCLGVLMADPGHAAANHLLGSIILRQGQAERAQPYLQQAWEVDPSEGAYWLTLAECLLALGQFEDASVLIKQAIKRGMDVPQMQQLKLIAKRGKDRTAPPAAVVDEMLVLFNEGRNAALEARVLSLLEQYPGWVFGWRALGAAMGMLGRDAEPVLRRAIMLAPQDASTHNNLGVVLRERGRHEESLTCLRKAIQLSPKYAEAHYNLGTVLQDMSRFDEATTCFRKAIKIKPDYFEAQAELGNALSALGRFPEALEVLGKMPKSSPEQAKSLSNLLFNLTHRGDIDAATLFSEHCRFGAQFDTPLQDFTNVREPERDLRVGIVSGDFYLHAVANFIEPVLMHLTQCPQLSLHAYYNHVKEDEVTQRLKVDFEQWTPVFGLTDEELAQKIRADGIDILIDLSGHTQRNRLSVFARKPAPLQVSWIGYPNTTGLQAMDYYLADRYWLPAGKFDDQFTEKIVHLPAIAPFLPVKDAPEVNALPALENGYVTFGSFNRPNKISQPVIALWARLLLALPGSKLLLGAMPKDGENDQLIAWFAQEGIARERLSFHPRAGIDAYLALHQQVDICLDTFPYSGSTTTFHALWMGVPTVTLAGETMAGRAGAMIFGHLGLDELVAVDADDFVRKGLYWAGNLAELAALRAGMRMRFEQSVLGRPDVIAAGLVQALRIMWRRWCEGLSAESFEVGAPSPAKFNADEILQHAVAFYQAGRLAEAEELCLSILQTEPGHAGANYCIGLMALQQGRVEIALPYLQTAWECAPSEGSYWLTLTECLLALGRFEDALGLIEEAIRRGMDTEQALQLKLFAQRGRDGTAPSMDIAEEALALFNAARYVELEQRMQPLLQQYPGWSFGWKLRGAAAVLSGGDAEDILRRAVELAPYDADTHSNLGAFLRDRGRKIEALTSLRRAIELEPESVDANFNLAATLQDLSQYDGAIASFRKVLEIRPDYVGAQVSLGITLAAQGKVFEALRMLRQVLAVEPNHVVAHDFLLLSLIHSGEADAEEIFAEHCSFGEKFEASLRDTWPVFSNTREPERLLRVGIVSADLFSHAVANFLMPLLAHLSPHVSLNAYYNHILEDDVTKRLRGYFAQWEVVVGLSDEALAQKIRADGIDILIDLSGHTARNRLLTFARRAAPVQVSWIGYPGTTGLQAMDYYLADRFWLPPGKLDSQFTEKIVRLPAIAPFLPAGGAPEVNSLPALENGYITFGSFNRPNKISQSVVALWSRLLNALPDARMLLGAMPVDGKYEELVDWFVQEGIALERLSFYPQSGMDVYLALHQRVDICLDTFPYNGSTTSLHAVWMGVPTVTLAGETMAGRAGAMIFGHLGLDELVAVDADDFVRKGLYWAGHLTELAALRAGMRMRFEQSVLGRPDVIAAGLVQALRIMWRRWCEGLPTESFDAEATVTPVEVLRRAAAFYQAGRLAEAEELCLGILQTNPGHADANYNLGLMALQQGQAERALPYLQAAWEGAPSEGDYWLTLVECLLALARFEDALGLSEEAISRCMDTPQAQQLKLLAQRGKNAAGPDMAAAQAMQALFVAGRYADMEHQARSLLDQYPAWALGWKALGVALQLQEKDAEPVLRRAVEIAPRDAETHNNLGVYLRKHGRPAEAAASLQTAVQIQPTFAEAHLRLGGALTDLREFDLALASLQSAAELRDGYAEAYQGMGAVLNGLGRFDAAVASYRRALEIKPDYVDARINLASALLGQGKISEAKSSYRQALKLMPESAELYSNYLYCLSHDDECDSGAVAAEHRAFGECFETPLRKEWGGYANVPDPARRLRVGFVSADLFNHAVASFIEPVLSHLAQSQNVVLHAYANTAIEDGVTSRLKGYFSQWDRVAGMSDEALAQKIRTDGVDILIDLSGHSAHNRLLTFARKPAPLQASWIGYPGTTGLQAMDYYLADRLWLPPGELDDQFTEKIVRLPAIATFSPAGNSPAVNALPALESGHLTFGSFNRPSKLSRPVIALWSRLLRALPDSRMVLASMPADGDCMQLTDWFAQEGVARERLSFHPRSGMDSYLALHQQVDICLDTFPYNGMTTSFHAVWMGVPTLTLAGSTIAGRVGATIFGHLGLSEFVAEDSDDFVRKGEYWAEHLSELAKERAGMRARFEQSALGRPELIAAGLEQAVRIMWRRWCAGLPAESFEVQGKDNMMREIG